MKKVSLLALILSTTTANWASAQAPQGAAAPTNCQKAFQGFHLGGNIGYGIGIGHEKFAWRDSFTDAAGDVFSTNRAGRSRLSMRGVDGGLGVGYTQRFGNFALGLAFDANWTGVDGKASFAESNVVRDAAGDPTSTVARAGTSKARLRNSLQLYARLGYVIGAQAMPFIKLGWDNSQWKHSGHFRRLAVTDIGTADETRRPLSGSSHKSKRLNGFLWGLGVDFLAWKHVVVGFEYTGTIAGKQTFRGRNANAANAVAGQFKPQYNKFALTAKIVY